MILILPPIQHETGDQTFSKAAEKNHIPEKIISNNRLSIFISG
jgi:hypothetical protein